MTDGLRATPGRGAERGLLAAAMLGAVGCAALDGGGARAGFVAASCLGTGLAALAWHRGEVTTREVLGFAVLFRLIALPLPPSLSDDGYRYVWDGLLQLGGVNPYAFRPSDPALAGWQAGLSERLNSADYYSVYPPASQLVFALGGVFGWPVGWTVIKAVFVGIELAGVWALSRLVSARALVLYAWHPLVVIETAGQGHTEAGMAGMLLLAVWAFRRRRPGWSVAALTVAGWFKLYPFVLVPFLLRRAGWRWAWVAAGVSVVLAVPYAAPFTVPHVAESLGLYTRLFEFNAGPYYVLKEAGRAWTGGDVSKSLGPLLQHGFLAGLAGLYLLDGFRPDGSRPDGSRPDGFRPLAWACLAALGLLWATATTVHPWYLVGVLALLPLTLGDEAGAPARLHAAAWLWLSLGALGTYLFYTHGPVPYGSAVILGWGGWAVLLAMAGALAALPALMRRRAAGKWRWLRPHLGTPARVLDLGAGDGFVGEAVARGGAEVVLADVVDFNRTALPLTLYDGQRLPFDADTFDATVLAFVLHHAADPDAVLREARRVTRGRVAVLESIAETPRDRRWLRFADRLANRLRSGGQMGEEHLRFGTAEDWRARFAAAGFRVAAEARRGRRLHKRHLFVLE